MLLELLNLNIFSFFLVFARVGSAFAVMPGFSSSFVSVKFRLTIALATTFLLTPLLAADLPAKFDHFRVPDDNGIGIDFCCRPPPPDAPSAG